VIVERASKLALTISVTAVLAGFSAIQGANPASAAASTPGVTRSSIDIGTTAPLTGPEAPGYDEIAPAMESVFAWVNAHGGVYGRKIHLTYLDDSYDPSKTVSLTRQLVQGDGLFAVVGGIGAPTQMAVQAFLNSEKVPQLFVGSGCNCWNERQYPYSIGWQPPYTVEGKILGYYLERHFAGKKVGYLYEDDEFGLDVTKGLDREIPASSVVSRQSYDPAALSAPLEGQMEALQRAGAQVVVLASVPSATALAMLGAASIGYTPQYAVESMGADAPTVGPLLSEFTVKNGEAPLAQAAPALLNGVISDAYMPPESGTTNLWVRVERKLLEEYAPALYAMTGLDGDTEYGVALAYTFVDALQAAGRDLTRAGILRAIASSGSKFATPGFVPPSYSKSDHFGLEGAEVVRLSVADPPALTPGGSWIGTASVSPVYVTGPGRGPVKSYRGAPMSPPEDLVAVLGKSGRRR